MREQIMVAASESLCSPPCKPFFLLQRSTLPWVGVCHSQACFLNFYCLYPCPSHTGNHIAWFQLYIHCVMKDKTTVLLWVSHSPSPCLVPVWNLECPWFSQRALALSVPIPLTTKLPESAIPSFSWFPSSASVLYSPLSFSFWKSECPVPQRLLVPSH